jgi:hypothetical protein
MKLKNQPVSDNLLALRRGMVVKHSNPLNPLAAGRRYIVTSIGHQAYVLVNVESGRCFTCHQGMGSATIDLLAGKLRKSDLKAKSLRTAVERDLNGLFGHPRNLGRFVFWRDAK